MTVGSTVTGTAVSVSTDMTEGIIARFRTMAIHRGSVLTGHVVGSVLQSILSVASSSAPSPWPSASAPPTPPPSSGSPAFGLLALLRHGPHLDRGRHGPGSPNAEAASNNAMPLILLPLLASAFVPTDSMPGRSSRSPSTSRSPRSSKPSAACCSAPRSATTPPSPLAWCAGIAAVSYLWAKKTYNKA